ncbi:MAG: RNA polymerase sigma factor [Bacteroidota bacterium]
MSLNTTDFASLYQQYKSLVYNVALSYVQNIEDAEEITQDVFIQLHQSIGTFNNQSSLKTWIYRIVINKSLDFLKHKESQKRFFIFGKRSENEYEIQNISNFEHPGILLENQEKSKMLFQVINELNENQKTAFILSKIDGLSNPEIASIMQLTVSSIESLLFRAKDNLKKKLADKFEEYRKKK